MHLPLLQRYQLPRALPVTTTLLPRVTSPSSRTLNLVRGLAAHEFFIFARDRLRQRADLERVVADLPVRGRPGQGEVAAAAVRLSCAAAVLTFPKRWSQLRLHFGVVIVFAWLVQAAMAFSQDLLSGKLSGFYSCGGEQAALTLTLDGEAGVFEFAYPSGATGSFAIRVTANMRTGTVYLTGQNWIYNPNNYSMISLQGTLSADRTQLRGQASRPCGDFAVSGPPLALANTQPAAPAGPGPDGAPPVPSSWESSVGCHGLKELRLTFRATGADGSNVDIRAMSEKDVTYTEMRGQMARDPSVLYGWLLRATPPAGPFSRTGLSMVVEPMVQPGALAVNIREPWCNRVRLLPASTRPAPAQSPSVPATLAHLLGAWDGVAYANREDKALPVSLTLRPSTAGVQDRPFDAELVIDGEAQASAGMGTVEWIEIRPLDRKPLAWSASIYPRLRDGGTRPLILGVLHDYNNLNLFLWKRPDAETSPLLDMCQTRFTSWIERSQKEWRAARDLKVDLYPSLRDYDLDQAAMVGSAEQSRAISDGSTINPAELVELCALTAKTLASLGDGTFLNSIIDGEKLRARRLAMAQYSDDSAAVLGTAGATSAPIDPERALLAEKTLRDGFATNPPMTTLAEIDALLRANLALIQASRPTALAEILKPAIAALEISAESSKAAKDADRAAFAKSRMAGLEPPVTLPSGMRAVVDAISAGQAPDLSKADIGFFAGLMDQSLTDCSLPRGATTMNLARLFSQGAALTLGSDFSSPYLGKMMGSQMAGMATVAAGSSFGKSLDCGDRWRQAFFDVLARAAGDRFETSSGRAPLFVRSCAVRLSVASCECLMREMDPFIPGLGGQNYSPSLLKQVFEMNPVNGPKIGFTCGIGSY